MQCRACGGRLIYKMANLGCMALANSYLKSHEISKEETFPLSVSVCESCFLAQVEDVVPPEKIFSEYAYFSSYSSSWLKHVAEYVTDIIEEECIQCSSLVVEVASNDGYLLKNFVSRGIPVLGIEPANNIAEHAQKNGVRTVSSFLCKELAKDLAGKYGKADLLIGNNVLAHVPDIKGFVQGLSILLNGNGLLTMEFPHLLKLLENNQFDTIYHEHYSYLSLLSVTKIFSEVGLCIHDVKELSTHGGSLRVYISHISANRAIGENVRRVIQEETNYGLDSGRIYDEFNRSIEAIKNDLIETLKNLKAEGKSIIAYGAAAKGNTLLNFCKLDEELIDYVVDVSPNKQGLVMPGNHLYINSPCVIKETKPDYILVLPWNLKSEIIEQLKYCRDWGTKFILPIPNIEIL